MNRKYNPYVSLAALVLLALILVLTCTGCHVEAEAAEKTNSAPRFTREYAGDYLSIITDTRTGVQYIAYKTTHGTGLCKLED